MLYERKVGAARVGNVVELIAPAHDPAKLFAELAPEDLDAQLHWLAPEHYSVKLRRLIMGYQIWMIDIGGALVLIDGGVGNHKARSLPRFNQLNTQTPLWMEAFGATTDSVTHVVMTHLHADHVGWNTCLDGGRWKPYFRNATYHIPQDDLEYFRSRVARDGLVREFEAMADSVEPLLDAGRAQLYQHGASIVPGMAVRAARGHTPGQHVVVLESEGHKAVFCGDIFHSPLQIAFPRLNTPSCVEHERARQTRLAFLQEVADSGTLIMPCHFGHPHCGRVTRTKTGFAFVPEAAEERDRGAV